MRERPILFSGPMVRAILEGRKMQTRRVMKPQPATGCRYDITGSGNAVHIAIEPFRKKQFDRCFVPVGRGALKGHPNVLACPYGQTGDRLWVREMGWYDREPCIGLDARFHRCFFEGGMVKFENGYYGSCPGSPESHTAESFSLNASLVKRPSIHMPRWASRFLLELVQVRVERLNDISRDDAIQEGIEHLSNAAVLNPWRNYLKGKPGEMVQHCSCPRRSFQTLWDSINEKRGHGWNSNPWVWVVGFKRVEGESDHEIHGTHERAAV